MKNFKKGIIPELDFRKAVKKPIPVSCAEIDDEFEVETMEGTMKGKKGDYLIIGVNGEMYPIDREIFGKTYDLIN